MNDATNFMRLQEATNGSNIIICTVFNGNISHVFCKIEFNVIL